MTALYADPANQRIEWSYMLTIAGQKLEGLDVEPLLRSAREVAAKALERSLKEPN